MLALLALEVMAETGVVGSISLTVKLTPMPVACLIAFAPCAIILIPESLFKASGWETSNVMLPFLAVTLPFLSTAVAVLPAESTPLIETSSTSYWLKSV